MGIIGLSEGCRLVVGRIKGGKPGWLIEDVISL